MLFRDGQPPRVLESDDRIDLDGVLDDFKLTVRELFDTLQIGSRRQWRNEGR